MLLSSALFCPFSYSLYTSKTGWFALLPGLSPPLYNTFSLVAARRLGPGGIDYENTHQLELELNAEQGRRVSRNNQLSCCVLNEPDREWRTRVGKFKPVKIRSFQVPTREFYQLERTPVKHGEMLFFASLITAKKLGD